MSDKNNENPKSNEETRDPNRNQPNTGWLELKREIIKFNQLREAFIKNMEDRSNPVFRHYLEMYRKKMSPEDFDLHRLKVYALCNEHVKNHCPSVDEKVNDPDK